jgi:Ca2+-binding RTX toxin-like protein
MASISGTAADDTLTGTAGNDTITGLGGDDLLAGLAGNDLLDGGAGWDWADYGDATGAVVVNLATVGAQNTVGAGTDTLVAIEGVIGSAFADRLTGSVDHTSWFSGGAGNDTITGRGVDYSRTATTGVDVNLQTGSASDGQGGTDTLINVYSVVGTDFDDTIVGSNQYGALFGDVGNDLLEAGSARIILDGGSASDTLIGGSFNDLLDGGAGRDSMTGGDGNDVYVVDRSSDRVIEAGTSGIDTVVSSVTWTLRIDLESLTLAGRDPVDGTGNDKSNLIKGNTSDNTLDGRQGNDTLKGGWGADSLVGGAGNDRLESGSDSDADTMVGGAGNDYYLVLSNNDQVVETGSAEGGVDWVHSYVDFALGPYVENLALRGSGDIDGTGNASANALSDNSGANRLDGRGGDDTLNSAGYDLSGFDTLVGGRGNDTYTVDRSGDVIIESSTLATEVDTVQSYVTWSLGLNVENLKLIGGSSIHGTGNALANVLTGNEGWNRLGGRGGNDTLLGGSGNDTLSGGLGSDLLTGGAGQDSFRFDTNPNTTSNVDRISDFVAADDGIQLDDDAFAGIGAVGALPTAAFRSGAAAGDADDRIVYDSATGQLWFDADGIGSGTAILFATVAPGTTLTAGDIVII